MSDIELQEETQKEQVKRVWIEVVENGYLVQGVRRVGEYTKQYITTTQEEALSILTDILIGKLE